MTTLPQSSTRVSACFPARVDEVAQVGAVVDVLAGWHALPPAILYGLHVVLDELLANVVEHAGAPAGARVTFTLTSVPMTSP